MTVRICCAKFAHPILLGNGINMKELDLRGSASRVKNLVESMTYNPDNGEVVIVPTKLCNVTGGKRLRFRIPGSAVVNVIEAEEMPEAKPEKAKATEKPAIA